jgi:hypothetical protein
VTRAPFQESHGTTPNLIYVKGVPNTPTPYPTTFDRKQCFVITIELRLCRRFGCAIKIAEKTSKYAPPRRGSQANWNKVDFVAIPASIALTTTQERSAVAFSAVRPQIK